MQACLLPCLLSILCGTSHSYSLVCWLALGSVFLYLGGALDVLWVSVVGRNQRLLLVGIGRPPAPVLTVLLLWAICHIVFPLLLHAVVIRPVINDFDRGSVLLVLSTCGACDCTVSWLVKGIHVLMHCCFGWQGPEIVGLICHI